jgi:lipoprotein-anchoring transpeptidase ErfK/SrfK
MPNKYRKGENPVTTSCPEQPPKRGYRVFVRLLLLILVVSAVAGCGGDGTASTDSDVAEAKKAVPNCVARSTRPVGSARKSYAAVVQERAQAYRKPGSTRIATFGPMNVNGVPTVFAVLAKRVDRACVARWYRVQLPLKPNGTSGWVRASDVEFAPVTTRIEVDLSERRVTLFDRGRRVLSATAAIGSPQTPTPTGRYYVNQRLIPADASGPFGPGAIGISAFSNVLTGWTQGGPIAIHGTNRPDLLGRAVSNGCIRVRNDLLQRLFDRTRAGTPVTVHA